MTPRAASELQPGDVVTLLRTGAVDCPYNKKPASDRHMSVRGISGARTGNRIVTHTEDHMTSYGLVIVFLVGSNFGFCSCRFARKSLGAELLDLWLDDLTR